MNKISKLLCVGLTLGLFTLTGCQNLSFTSNQIKDTLPVGKITLDDVSKQVSNLVKSQLLPNDTTISVMLTDCKEEKEKHLLNAVADNLIKSGYAVEKVLPAKERQKGDVAVVKASGTKLALSLVPLIESDYLRLKIDLAGIYYYRMYSLTNKQLVPVSAWSMQSL